MTNGLVNLVGLWSEVTWGSDVHWTRFGGVGFSWINSVEPSADGRIRTTLRHELLAA